MKILTLNVGSSSVKVAAYATSPTGPLELIKEQWALTHGMVLDDSLLHFQRFLDKVDDVGCIVHRITHGGESLRPVVPLSNEEVARLERWEPLAPLHQPHNLRGIILMEKLFASQPRKPVQLGCYDTVFHQTIPQERRRFPLPIEGLPTGYGLRYGFHGINYAYLVQQLPGYLPLEKARGRVVLAHLGSGSSVCLVYKGQSLETTMGLTPLGGLIMGTRSGELDPGIVLELVERHGLARSKELLYRHSGLLALSSGISSDMQVLIEHPDPLAQQAVDRYVDSVSRAIASLVATHYQEGSQPLEALVFSGGIGENSSVIRSRVVDKLAYLNVKIDPAANAAGSCLFHAREQEPSIITPHSSDIALLCLKANESYQMAAFAQDWLAGATV